MLIHSLFPEVVPASSVLETALSNMNAVFHPPGMLMNTGWIESTDGNFLFYNQGITEAVGRVVSAVDAERMAIARALGVPCRSFIQRFYEAGLTTKEAFESGSVARACRESEPNRTIKSPSSLDDRYIHEDVGFGLVPMTALARLAGIETPTIDALIHLVSKATGIRYDETGLTLKKMGLHGIALEDLFRFVQYG
jgi:opine dehydrogenase